MSILKTEPSNPNEITAASEQVSEDSEQSLQLTNDTTEVEDIFLISPEEYFPDCGCGLVEECVTQDCLEHDSTDASGSNKELGLSGTEHESAEPEHTLDKNAQTVEKGDVHSQIETKVGQDETIEKIEEIDAEQNASALENTEVDAGVQLLLTRPISADREESSSDSTEEDEDPTCFVATAAFRSHAHPDVAFLRMFRNRTLKKYFLGRVFIELYWRIGPKLAKPVSRSEILACLSRALICGIVFLLRRFR